MNYKCIVIDDEALAIDVLEDYISKFPVLELVGSFDSPLKAINTILTQSVDLIFLDINMPDINGISFYENLPIKPKVIFTTAYSDFAVKGFEINAIDYLVKPISFERFFMAVNKLMANGAHIPVAQASPINFSFNESQDYIFVRAEYASIKINLKDIVILEGYKDYVKIHLIDDPKPISRNRVKMKTKEEFILIGNSYKDFFYELVVNNKI